ncbi:hypothetical protein [Methanolapillus ohkumae]|uniref:hypothetical protein n=1 Tax=Methanolapillus ohkumae TaxID=3028298 RepID=UPI0030B86EF1
MLLAFYCLLLAFYCLLLAFYCLLLALLSYCLRDVTPADFDSILPAGFGPVRYVYIF